jgi:hypothetical protein
VATDIHLDHKEIVTRLPELSIEHNEVCKGCALVKYVKIVFPSSDSRSKGILDLMHSDVCGPMSSTSLTRCEYFVTFIDDFSKET